jgi:hypothetical protein
MLNRIERPNCWRKARCILNRGSIGKGMPSLRSLPVDLFFVALAAIAAAITRDNFVIVAPRLIAVLPYLVITLGVAGLARVSAGRRLPQAQSTGRAPAATQHPQRGDVVRGTSSVVACRPARR